jgi:hypothetical protein
MKARQIATALNSVYAVDPGDRIRAIERGPDGLWSSWQDVGVEARQIVHEGDVVARIGPDHRVSALQLTPRLQWFSLDLEATCVAATRLADGAPVLFASDGDQSVWYTWKHTPASPWTDWEPLDGPAVNLAPGVIPGGGLVVFGIHDGAIYHRWQDQPLASWKEWTRIEGLPNGVRELEVTTISGGGLVLFALGSDTGLYHRWQDKPFGRWHPWEPLGTGIGSFSVTKAPAGGLASFAIGMDGALRYRRQARPFGEWSPWTELDGAEKSVSAQASYTDGLEVFTIGLDDEVYHKWCEELDGPWTDWIPLDHETSPFRLGRMAPFQSQR